MISDRALLDCSKELRYLGQDPHINVDVDPHSRRYPAYVRCFPGLPEIARVSYRSHPERTQNMPHYLSFADIIAAIVRFSLLPLA